MSLFSNRSNSALLVIDVQNGVVEGAHQRDAVIAHINSLISNARAKDVPVIWVQHSDEELVIDTPGWQIVPELVPLVNEPVVRKLFRSSFEETELDEVLVSKGVSHLYITGAQTNNCIRHTCHAALERGYDITLIGDAHTTTGYEWNGHAVIAADVISEQNDNLSRYDLPGRNAQVIESAAITF
jgi:nicotinamidase-related amidase